MEMALTGHLRLANAALHECLAEGLALGEEEAAEILMLADLLEQWRQERDEAAP